MNAFFDSSVLVAIERQDKQLIGKLALLKQVYPETPRIPFMTYAEFVFGVRNRKPHNKEKARAFLEQFPMISTTKMTAEIVAEIKESSEREALGLTLSDMLIAAQAIEHGAMLLTRDTDFTKIRGLQYTII